MKLNEKIYNCILCAVIGDIIGFGNGEIEFNNNIDLSIKGDKDLERLSGISPYHVSNFISNGGMTNYDMKNKNASDDTILLLATFDAMISTFNLDDDKILNKVEELLLKYYNNDKKKEKRGYGNRTIMSLKRLNDGKDWRKWGFAEKAGGSGASMRSMGIGLIYNGKKNRNKLIKLSILSSVITHNNPLGYLGGLASALFTAYAFEGVSPDLWPFELLKILKSKELDVVIDDIVKHYPETKNKHLEYIKQKFQRRWENYIEFRFNDGKFIELEYLPDWKIFDLRSIQYYKYFGSDGYFNPGSNGCDSVIIAYDCFRDSKTFESLIYYAMLHVGDSDTTGCIAGAFHGAYYGNKVKLVDNLKDVEFANEIKKLCEKATKLL